jgi:DNA modification methylase
MSDYADFLAHKRIVVEPAGFKVKQSDLNPMLFDWQAKITRWALARGRSALFLDTGLGKSAIQLEWAHHVVQHTKGKVLILAPLAVSSQTEREAQKFGIQTPVTVCKTGADVRDGINITNYERLHHFDQNDFVGIIIDESSILKGFAGKVRAQITEFAQPLQYRLACTATPAPNDLIEITNHAEFLDIMTGKEIIALFFRVDGNTTHSWRLKGHAAQDFWKWMAEWSVAVRMPSDLGYEDGDFVLPPLRRHSHVVASAPLEGQLFPIEARSLLERRQARRESMTDRVRLCADIVAEKTNAPWIVWCDLNMESEALTKAIPGAVEIRGSHSPEYKEQTMIDFSDGKVRVLVSKPSICGHGMNWQHCSNMAFVGLSDSFEQLYQATRRCWRFGQKNPVDVHIITAESEGAVVRNIERKEMQAKQMMDNITDNLAIHELNKQSRRTEMEYKEVTMTGEDWIVHLGDSCEVIQRIESESIGLSVFSPPFPGWYVYNNSARDIGNASQIAEMMEHYQYLAGELLRVTMPGRLCCVHLCQLTAMKNRDGYIGIKDYRGAVINCMEDKGWRYAGEVTIDKNPQVQAVRNKERGLLFKSLATDSAMMRMALADYIIYFRKDGENPIPIRAGQSKKYNPDGGWITEKEWIEWAAPVWYRHQKGKPGGISETDVLNVACARDNDDERHLCPLQLGVIERCVKLWSAPGDIVLDPFAGIGSTGYKSLLLHRKFVGIELKPSYHAVACKNMERALKERVNQHMDLFTLAQAK